LDIFENISGTKNPFTKYYTLPRLFVIKNDGSGYEMLTKEQLDYYFRQQKHVSERLYLILNLVERIFQAEKGYQLWNNSGQGSLLSDESENLP
jgi:hypothetical protein